MQIFFRVFFDFLQIFSAFFAFFADICSAWVKEASSKAKGSKKAGGLLHKRWRLVSLGEGDGDMVQTPHLSYRGRRERIACNSFGPVPTRKVQCLFPNPLFF